MDLTINSSSKFSNYFQFEMFKNEKVGVCKICGSSNILKIISRKKSDTTGMRRHLLNNHPKAYAEIYGTSTLVDQSVLTSRKQVNYFIFLGF